MKKIILIVLILLVMLIPTYYAFASYLFSNNAPESFDFSKLSEISITAPNGENYSYDKENNGEFINYIASLQDKAYPNSLPDSKCNDQTKYIFKYSFDGTKSTAKYEYYLFLDTLEVYFTDNNGNSFKADTADVYTLLSEELAYGLYDTALPTLSVAGNAILPFEMEYSYILTNKNEVSIDTSAAISDKANSVIAPFKAFRFNFSISPDKITDFLAKCGNDELSMALSTDGIISCESLLSEKTVNITFTAVWDNDLYKGRASYSLTVTFPKSQAEFYLTEQILHHVDDNSYDSGTSSDGIVYLGDALLMSAVGVNKDDIIFKVSPSYDFTPVYFEQNGYIKAFIPIPLDIKAGTYTFTFSDGLKEKSFTIEIKDPKFINVNSDKFTQNLVDTAYSKAAQDEFSDLMKEIIKNPTKNLLIDGAFSKGKFETVNRGFGRKVYFNGEYVYTSFGINFYAGTNKNAPVNAVNKGTVAYVGECDFAGKFIVVDHGANVFSWYLYLDAVNVKVGDGVDTKTKIGTTGQTGGADTELVCIAVSVGDVFIDTNRLLWDYSLDTSVNIG